VSGSNPDFPPQQFEARYELGFDTDRALVEPSPHVWDFLFRAVENFICSDPYVASHEIEGSNGARFMLTAEAGFLDCPELIVYFKPDQTTRRVAFLTVHRADVVPGGWVDPDGPPGRF
jgi:hypothetical protein